MHPAMHLPVPAVSQITNPTIKNKSQRLFFFPVLINTKNKNLPENHPGFSGMAKLPGWGLWVAEVTFIVPVTAAVPWAMSAQPTLRSGHSTGAAGTSSGLKASANTLQDLGGFSQFCVMLLIHHHYLD